MPKNKLNNALPLGTILLKGKWKYTIDKVLGAGGFGITYRVQGYVGNIRLYFAVKEFFMDTLCERINGKVSYSPSAKDEVVAGKNSFLAEANRLKSQRISHENLVGINEVFEENNTVYYVMEYIPGMNMRQQIEQNRSPYSESDAKTIITPVLRAIASLHAHQIVHLDIKPDNILLQPLLEDPDRIRPIIVDFGLSKHYDVKGQATSKISLLACTPGYAPNEQYQGISQFTPQADVYAAAGTLFYMLTGKDPVKASDINRAKIEAALPDTLSQVTKTAIVNAMKQDKNERTQSIDDFAEALGIELSKEKDDGKNGVTVLIDIVKKKLKKVTGDGEGHLTVLIGIVKKKLKKVTDSGGDRGTVVISTVQNIQKKRLPLTSMTLGGMAVLGIIVWGIITFIPSPAPTPIITPTPIPTPTPLPPPPPDSLAFPYGVWKGGIKNEHPHGKGILTFTDNQKGYEIGPFHLDVEAGYTLKGLYENGRLVSGQLYDAKNTLVKTIIP
ncbi:MAG: protein kinase [Prevotellaceae bacterium]|jgi:serine/threonine protein kinase|nr:protein kinase [Prevotellaceae bacterium]